MIGWQGASMLVLAVALVAGAVWYERSRPRSQVVALVAALAAIAAAGRVAFAPIPNVTPTTDIALLSGYALGGAPGFMVGSLAALVSNLWLGQGPWTPWQMLGWGLTGIFGAALAWASGRRLGRWGLAIACGAAGLAYGILLDFSAMVIFGGEVSLERYLALSARGIPFNLAHAAGNFALALAAGPAIVDLLRRHRERFAFAWRSSAGPTLVIVGAVAASAIGFASLAPAPERAQATTVLSTSASATVAQRATASRRSRTRALAWLERRQFRNGGFGAGGGFPASPEMTGWASLGLAAAGVNPLDVSKRSNAIDYLRRNRSEIDSSGDIERTILAVAAARLDPATFAGARLVRRLAKRQRPDGSVEGQVNLTAFYVLAMDVAGRSTRRAAGWLGSAQGDAGGWGYTAAARPDADSTGAALQALVAAGRGSRARARGAAWLRAQQGRDGGWAAVGAGSRSNSQSTAWAIQGLVAAGVNPRRVTQGGRSGFDFLRARQAADGHYRYSAASDQTPVWVTSQALAAMASEPYPVVAPPAEASSRSQGGADAADSPGSASAPDAGVAGTDTELGGPGGGSKAAAPGDGSAEALPGGQDPNPGTSSPQGATESSGGDGGSTVRGLAIGLGLVALALAGMGAARLARSRGWL